MKKVLKGFEPKKLSTYRNLKPEASWEEFLNRSSRKLRTREQIVVDQGGLCAYCEVDLQSASSGGLVADLRVEHFHPKSDRSTTHNWALDWQNLLGCCHGGSQRNVIDAARRFTSPDHSCDVPKGNHNWDNVILNPLHLPAFPCLFQYNRSTGAIEVNLEACQKASINSDKAQDTIDKLCLDALRLRTLRKSVLDHVNDQLGHLLSSGKTIEEARAHVAQALLRKDSNGYWPTFFSAIRSYLGVDAEKQLQAIHYIG